MKRDNQITRQQCNYGFGASSIMDGNLQSRTLQRPNEVVETQSGANLSDLYVREGAKYPKLLSCFGALSEKATSAMKGIGSALASDSYQTHLMSAKSQMVLEGPAHQGFVRALHGFFSAAATDAEREHYLNALDQVALAQLLKALESQSGASTREQAQAHGITLGLLRSLFPREAAVGAYRRELKGLILRMHTDRTSPLNRDFGCGFRNDARDLLWKFVLFLHQQCGDGAFVSHIEGGQEHRRLEAQRQDTERRRIASFINQNSWEET